MQSFYGQLQRSMCCGKQAQTEEIEKFQELWKEQQRAKCSNREEIWEVCKTQEKEEDRKRASALSTNADFRWWK